MASKSKTLASALFIKELMLEHLQLFNEMPRLCQNTLLFKSGFKVSKIRLSALEKIKLRELLEDEE